MTTLTGTIEEREEIRELYTRYAITLDHGRYEEWLDCFTPDGTFESQRFGRHTGREGLRRFTVIYRESLGGAQTRHAVGNVSFTIDGERADGTCYLTYFHSRNGVTTLAAVGHYEDRLRKLDGRWRFESRRVLIDGRGH